jgi:hypothetical protein
MFAGACITALMLGCAALTPSQHYREYKDGAAIYAVMREEVRNGDSLDKIWELLGTNVYDSVTHRKGTQAAALATPAEFPDGIRETDMVLFYPYDDRGLATLIFRDNKLINHNPERYPSLKPDRRVRY